MRNEDNGLPAVLSCAYSYEVIAKKIVANAPNSVNDSFYGDWIKGDASEAYAARNVVLLDMLNALTRNATEAQISHLAVIIVACSRYEWAFRPMVWCS